MLDDVGRGAGSRERPEVFAAAQHQVSDWHAIMLGKVRRGEAREQRGGKTWFAHSAAQLKKDQSLAEVLGRGLDPERPRTFRGRILLTVRCETKGHALGRVYPTTRFPVFIPSVACLPVGRNALKENRFTSARHGNMKAFHQLMHEMGIPSVSREKWIEEYRDDDPVFDRAEVHFDIRGMCVLNPGMRDWEPTDMEGNEAVAALFLLCRCGQSIVAVRDLFPPIDAARPTLVVPRQWTGYLH